MILKHIKYLLLFLLTILLGAQTTYAKTEFVLALKNVSFSLEQNQSFQSLEKEVQPNIGFLKEKYRFVVSENVPAQNTYDFSEIVSEYVANAVVKNVDEIKHLLKTETNTAFFWSGKTNGIGGADKALDIAKTKGGTTLEGIIDSKGIKMPEWDFNNPQSMKMWEDVSASYANQVSGEVKAVIGNKLRPDNIWENVELPRLKDNLNVSKITTIDPVTLVETVIFVR